MTIDQVQNLKKIADGCVMLAHQGDIQSAKTILHRMIDQTLADDVTNYIQEPRKEETL